MSIVRRDVPGFDEVVRLDLGGTVAYLALHAVVRGRAFGGIRIRPYLSEEAALGDALDLARAMSRKVVLAGLLGGGGKTVMIEPPAGVDRAACMARLGEYIESLGGRYCCGPDLGFTAADDAALRSTTRHVACSGMSVATARTVRDTMFAVRPDIRRVALQGLGAVGAPLARMLEARGVEVVACDVRPEVEGALVEPDAILDEPADVFAPCAAGAVLDRDAVRRLRVGLVCGGANNPFASSGDARRLHARGIGYVPDVLSNCGAAIVGVSTTLGESDRIEERLAAVGPLAREICERAERENRSSHEVAQEMGDERVAELRASAAG